MKPSAWPFLHSESGRVSEREQIRVNSLVKGLVLSLDTRTIDQLGEALQAMGIAMETCVDAATAIRHIGREKLDGLFIDWQDRDQALELLQFVRKSSCNRTVVVFAITLGSSQAEDAFRGGAHFVIERPIAKPRLIRSLRAAYGLMLRERRRYFRYPVAMPVFLSRAGRRELETVTLNLSERGMAVMLPEGIKAGEEVGLRFQLPGNDNALRLKALICWTDPAGRRAGLQFAALTQACAEEVQEWVARRLEQSMPVANRAPVTLVAADQPASDK